SDVLAFSVFFQAEDGIRDRNVTEFRRVLFRSGIHIMCTAIAGWGIGWALFAAHKSRAWRAGSVLGWWLVAFSIHFAWNYDLVEQIGRAACREREEIPGGGGAVGDSEISGRSVR